MLSDLHMSLGADESGRWDACEAFRDDGVLADFFDWIATSAEASGRAASVVVLGDFLDLLHASAGEVRAAAIASERVALARISRVVRGHRRAFGALAELAARGVPITIVPGNHDIELLRPSAQEALRGALDDLVAGAAKAISFAPWVVYMPGLVYAEHGSQHHDLNLFPELLMLADRDIDPPLGSSLTLYLVALSTALAREGVTVEPSPHAVLGALRRRPAVAVRALGDHAAFVRALVAYPIRARRTASRRAAYAHTLRAHADELDLDAATVTALDGLAPRSGGALPARAARTAIRTVLQRLERPMSRGPRSATTDYLQVAARAVDRVLAERGDDVPFYVLGHSHRADDASLRPDGDSPRYLNTGTWSSLTPRGLDAPTARFTFVTLSRSGHDAPTASLLRWNPTSRRPEPCRRERDAQPGGA